MRARQLEVEGQVFVVGPSEYVSVRKLEYYRESGSEKHLRDIRSMLDASPDAIRCGVFEQQIAAGYAGEGLRAAAVKSGVALLKR